MAVARSRRAQVFGVGASHDANTSLNTGPSAYAEAKGYNLEREAVDRYDVHKRAYKNSAVDAEWTGWQTRAKLHAAIEAAKK